MPRLGCFLLQFRSDEDPREEYIVVTGKNRERWNELALPGFTVTAAAAMQEILAGNLAYFTEPREHRYWLRAEWDDNPSFSQLQIR